MEKFKKSGVVFYDFTDPKKVFGKNMDCEFIDGHHAGDVLYARMIRDIFYHDSHLLNLVNIDFLNTFIHSHQGLAEGVTTYNRGAKELDFLGLGCNKTIHY